MKLDKNKNSRIEIRLNEDDKILLEYLAIKNGYTLSKYLRVCVDTLILPYKKMIQQGDFSYADAKAFCDNILQYRNVLKK